MVMQQVTITANEGNLRARIISAFFSMPYGSLYQARPMVNERWGAQPFTTEEFLTAVATNLEELKTVLERIAADNRAESEELQQYRRAAEGMRFLLNVKD
jgi:truncated hemoglobin YjbI